MAERTENDYFKFARNLHPHEIIEVGIHLKEGFLGCAYQPEDLSSHLGDCGRVECGTKGGHPFLYNSCTKQFVFIGNDGAQALYNILNIEFAKRQAHTRRSRHHHPQPRLTLDEHLQRHFHVSEGLTFTEHLRAYGLFEEEDADSLNDLFHLIAATGYEGTLAEDDPTGRTPNFEVDRIPDRRYRVRHLHDPDRKPLLFENPSDLIPLLERLITEKCHGFDYESWIAMQDRAARKD